MTDTMDDVRRMIADEQDERLYGHLRPDGPCACGKTDWRVTGTDPAYGADADGRRGTLLVEYECGHCKQCVEVY